MTYDRECSRWICADDVGMTAIAMTERTDQGEQFILPGAERSARQASAARAAKLRARKPQLPPGGLFEAAKPEEPALL